MTKKLRSKYSRLREAQEFCEMFNLPEPRRKFEANIESARTRGIQWRLTFDEWWGLWKPHYHLRGKGPGKMNLCRDSDQGAYEVGNVRIDTYEANMLERGEVMAFDTRARNGKGKGVALNTATRHPGYIKHFFPLPLSLMDPARAMLAKQELEEALRHLELQSAEANEIRKLELRAHIAASNERREASIERQRLLRQQQKQKR